MKNDKTYHRVIVRNLRNGQVSLDWQGFIFPVTVNVQGNRTVITKHGILETKTYMPNEDESVEVVKENGWIFLILLMLMGICGFYACISFGL